jgi:hypothetical protein
MIHITSTVKTLRDAMKPVGTIQDECRLNISPEGLSVKLSDLANVMIIDLALPKEVFHGSEYTVDETLQVGLDVIVIKDDTSEARTKTTSEAFMLGKCREYPGHTAVIRLDGFKFGPYMLERVRPA